MTNAILTPTMPTQVIEFNQRVLKIEPRPIGVMPQAEYEITCKSLKEEVEEFQLAYDAGDMLGQVDALIDNIYFTMGALYKMGLTDDDILRCFSAVHDANMEKKLGVNHRRGDGQAADAVKPEGWQPPEFRIGEILSERSNLVVED